MRNRTALTCLLVAALAFTGGRNTASATWPGENGELVVESSDGIYTWEIGAPAAARVTNNTRSYDFMPAWSPDGTEIAFARGDYFFNEDWTPYGIDIWVMNADGTNLRKLTNGVGWNLSPTWSPDGSMIAFESIRNSFTDIWSEGDYNIWVMYADGYNPWQLTNDPGWEINPDWSPDGSAVAFEAGVAVQVINIDGTNQRTLLSEPGYQFLDPTWSPDGSKIAATRAVSAMEAEEKSEVFSVDADGGNKRNLTNHPASDYMPVWSPDGTTIAFKSNRVSDDTMFLWLMDSDGGNPRSISVPSAIRYVESFDWQRIPVSRFDDVPATHVFSADVEWLASEGITKGCNPPFNTVYCPDASVTRGQMAAFLVRALDLPAGTPGVFTDDDRSVFEANIEALAESGITKGCNPPVNDHYCPNSYVTRGQMAAFLVRALGYTAGAGSDQFADDDGSIFEADIERLAEAGVTKGCNPPVNDHYCPNEYVTRGQMAAFLHRALPTTADEVDPLIAAGMNAASEYGCVACHTTDGSDWIGPSWKGLFERGDAAYVQQSILNPNAVIVDGYVDGVMPQNYETVLSQEDLDALAAYILSL